MATAVISVMEGESGKADSGNAGEAVAVVTAIEVVTAIVEATPIQSTSAFSAPPATVKFDTTTEHKAITDFVTVTSTGTVVQTSQVFRNTPPVISSISSGSFGSVQVQRPSTLKTVPKLSTTVTTATALRAVTNSAVSIAPSQATPTTSFTVTDHVVSTAIATTSTTSYCEPPLIWPPVATNDPILTACTAQLADVTAPPGGNSTFQTKSYHDSTTALSDEALTGIIAGCLVAVLIIAVIRFYFWHKKTPKKPEIVLCDDGFYRREGSDEVVPVWGAFSRRRESVLAAVEGGRVRYPPLDMPGREDEGREGSEEGRV